MYISPLTISKCQTVGATVENADRLLDIWIKVLSQSEHTQRLLLDGKWQGSTEVSPLLLYYIDD